ncbi:hypothetical protein P8A22_23525 [Streptomyces laculatispora]|uniref:Uncharacterized protein n=1 Tax=Streptomyces laculatispora TaxID=887464 RepID=A0ABY9I6Z1_9ACTN|nr:hypothetical protein [Streptomyces laculatispora]WLQ42648.1 hypothetical protein P8A22_23525 [Streptomyces laculatispora]
MTLFGSPAARFLLDSVLLVAIAPGRRVVVDFRARPGSRGDGAKGVAAADG